jgi:hypothetical protein
MDKDWSERIRALRSDPEDASRRDIVRLASELDDCRRELIRLQDIVCNEDAESISRVLRNES